MQKNTFMNEIQEWINGKRDYTAGLSLYSKYGRNVSLLRVLSVGGNTRKNIDTLTYELGKIARQANAPVKVANTVPFAPKTESNSQPGTDVKKKRKPSAKLSKGSSKQKTGSLKNM